MRSRFLYRKRREKLDLGNSMDLSILNERQREAVEWYAAAVRTEPTLWGDPGNHERLLPDWTGRERAILAEVHQAWQASPSHRR